MRKCERTPPSLTCSVFIAVTLCVLLGSTVVAYGTAYYSLLQEPRMTVNTPPVKLNLGISGNSTIYMNGTSARVSIGGGDFNYVLNLTENNVSNWKTRLKAYDQSNISRLFNCSIYIYNDSNSSQIVILNGNYSQQQGVWYDLPASDTEYIWMHIETLSPGTSYVYVYLEICVPDTTTYARYVISFEIT